jgi:hypothetical protein
MGFCTIDESMGYEPAMGRILCFGCAVEDWRRLQQAQLANVDGVNHQLHLHESDITQI